MRRSFLSSKKTVFPPSCRKRTGKKTVFFMSIYNTIPLHRFYWTQSRSVALRVLFDCEALSRTPPSGFSETAAPILLSVLFLCIIPDIPYCRLALLPAVFLPALQRLARCSSLLPACRRIRPERIFLRSHGCDYVRRTGSLRSLLSGTVRMRTASCLPLPE